MPWFKVDDNLGFHHKVIAAGNPAIGLWVRAGSVCSQQLTDGFVADHMAATLGTKAQAQRLVEVGLWVRVEGGYRFHEWAERQPSKADVEAERAAAADRMREHRARKKEAARKASAQVSEVRSTERTENERRTNAEVREVFGNPDPTRPDPTRPTTSPNGEGRAKRATQLPTKFKPSEQHQRIADEQNVDLDAEFAKFADHHLAKGSTFKDWDRALNNWLRSNYATKRSTRPNHSRPVALPPAPDGMTPDEYAAWEHEQRQKLRGA